MSFFQKKIKKEEAKHSSANAERHHAAPSAASFHNPKILEVNLIKDEASVSFDWNRNLLILGLVLVLGALLTAEAYWGLNGWEEREIARVAPLVAETDRLNAEVAKLRNEAAPALSYQEKAAVFSELLDNHVYWSGFFTWLEKNTLSTVKFESFNGDLTGEYDLQATASSFGDASWQAKALLNDPAVQSVTIKEVSGQNKNAGSGETGVSFGLSFKVKPEIFRK